MLKCKSGTSSVSSNFTDFVSDQTSCRSNQSSEYHSCIKVTVTGLTPSLTISIRRPDLEARAERSSFQRSLDRSRRLENARRVANPAPHKLNTSCSTSRVAWSVASNHVIVANYSANVGDLLSETFQYEGEVHVLISLRRSYTLGEDRLSALGFRAPNVYRLSCAARAHVPKPKRRDAATLATMQPARPADRSGAATASGSS